MKAWLAWPCLALISSLALAGCGSSSTAAAITITPTSATVLLNTSIQFIPSETGSSNAIQWSVNGIANGNATVGTISAAGLYTAPGTVPASATGVAVPIIFCTPNSSVPNSGSTGAVCELQAGSNLTNFVAGDTITIANNSQAGWDGSFIIQFAAPLSNGNFGVQIANPAGPPPTGTGGTATAVPNLTISAQVESTSAVATATVTLDSGVRVAFSETTFTIGTNEQFLFTPFISVSGSSNTAVTWSVSSGIGTIDPNSGLVHRSQYHRNGHHHRNFGRGPESKRKRYGVYRHGRRPDAHVSEPAHRRTRGRLSGGLSFRNEFHFHDPRVCKRHSSSE